MPCPSLHSYSATLMKEFISLHGETDMISKDFSHIEKAAQAE